VKTCWVGAWWCGWRGKQVLFFRKKRGRIPSHAAGKGKKEKKIIHFPQNPPPKKEKTPTPKKKKKRGRRKQSDEWNVRRTDGKKKKACFAGKSSLLARGFENRGKRRGDYMGIGGTYFLGE